MTYEQTHIIGHSLGINVYHAKTTTNKRDKKLPKDFYRNRFCTSDGHDDLPTIRSLASLGYMAQGSNINNGQSTMWFVTDEGIFYFREWFMSNITTQS